MALHSEPLSLEQATSLDRPGTYNRGFGLWENGGPWTWADPIQAIVSDSFKWRSWRTFDNEWGPYDVAASVSWTGPTTSTFGALRDGELVALLWHDHIVDDDPALMAEIAKECGL